MITALAIGPDGTPVTGQFVGFECYAKNSSYKPLVYNYSSGDSVFGKTFNNMKFVVGLFFLMLKNKPRVVYFTSSRSIFGFVRDFFIIVYACLFRAKLVNHLHGADFVSFYNGLSSINKKLVDLVYKKIDVSIVLSESMFEQYSKYTDTMELFSVPNCYSLKGGSDTSEYIKVDGTLKVLYLSNLMCSKGVLELVDAIAELKQKSFKIELKIAGNYLPDHLMSSEQIKQEFNKRGAGVAEYIGSVSGTKKTEVLEWADCLVLPTYYPTEAQPICIIEGMATGCYIISTKHRYIPDLIKSSNGELVEPKSVEGLVRAFEKIIVNNKLLEDVKKYNREYAKMNHSLTNYVTQIDSIVGGLID